MAFAKLTLDASAHQRYIEKLTFVELVTCPFEISETDWFDDVTQWSPITYPDLYSYLIDTPGQFTRENLKAYKSLEAYNYVINGWVQPLYVLRKESPQRIGQSFCIIRGKVMASQRLNDKPHQAWIAAQADGRVITGHCTCMAGLGEVCSHVAAVLFKVEMAHRLGHTSPSCTSQPCVWNQSSIKKVNAAPIGDIEFSRPRRAGSTEARQPAAKSAGATGDYAPSAVELDAFFDRLSEAPSRVVVLSATSKHCQTFCTSHYRRDLPLCMNTLFDPNCCEMTLTELQELSKTRTEKLTVTDSQITSLEQSTRKQHSSELWHQYRQGRLTASNFYTAYKLNENKPAPSFIRKICYRGHTRVLNVPAVVWGREHEDGAREMYCKIMSLSHANHSVGACGLFIHKTSPFLGASPDGLVLDDCCGRGILECKCPYSIKDGNASDAPYLYRNSQGELALDMSHQYYYQVQGQMEVCGVDYADFVVWTTRECAIVRVTRDHDFCAKMVKRLTNIYHMVIMPCILTDNVDVHSEQ